MYYVNDRFQRVNNHIRYMNDIFQQKKHVFSDKAMRTILHFCRYVTMKLDFA